MCGERDEREKEEREMVIIMIGWWWWWCMCMHVRDREGPQNRLRADAELITTNKKPWPANVSFQLGHHQLPRRQNRHA